MGKFPIVGCGRDETVARRAVEQGGLGAKLIHSGGWARWSRIPSDLRCRWFRIKGLVSVLVAVPNVAIWSASSRRSGARDPGPRPIGIGAETHAPSTTAMVRNAQRPLALTVLLPAYRWRRLWRSLPRRPLLLVSVGVERIE
jgi:hypothetical protein